MKYQFISQEHETKFSEFRVENMADYYRTKNEPYDE